MALIINAKGTMSGKEGAIVYSHNRFGTYTRRLVIPTNPASVKQGIIRSALQALSNMWTNTLDANKRAAWDSYAAAVPVTNRLNQVIHLTGLNMYVRTGVPAIQIGFPSAYPVAPAVMNLGSLLTPTVDTFVAGPPSTIKVTPNVLDDWYLSANGSMLVYASRPQGKTVNFFKGPYRLCSPKVTGGTPTQVVTLPFPCVAGQRIFFQARGLCADGRLSAAVQFQFDT